MLMGGGGGGGVQAYRPLSPAWGQGEFAQQICEEVGGQTLPGVGDTCVEKLGMGENLNRDPTVKGDREQLDHIGKSSYQI